MFGKVFVVLFFGKTVLNKDALQLLPLNVQSAIYNLTNGALICLTFIAICHCSVNSKGPNLNLQLIIAVIIEPLFTTLPFNLCYFPPRFRY